MARPYKPRKTPDWRRSYADSFFTGPAEHHAYAERFGKNCHICGVETANEPTDHLFPIALGGITVVGNLAIACAACNSGRGDKSPVRYFIERLNAKQSARYATVDEYISWLEDYMRPYKRNYPQQYAIAEAMVNDRRELRTSPKDDYLRELVDFRWRTTHDPLTLRELGVPSEYESYWKRIHMNHPDLYFPGDKKDPRGAFERYRNSNDPKWLKVIEATANLNSRELRDSRFATAEVIFADIETMGYTKAFKHWKHKHSEDKNREARDSIALALQAARPPKQSVFKRIFG